MNILLSFLLTLVFVLIVAAVYFRACVPLEKRREYQRKIDEALGLPPKD